MICALLTGCTSGIEPNDLAYIVAVGVDKNDEAKAYDITLQIANPQAISGGSNESGGEGGKKTITNLTVTSTDIFSAVNIANHLYSKDLSLAHTKLMVFCDEIAREGELRGLSETIARSEEIRPNTFLSVVKGSAKEYLGSIEPTNEVNPVKYYEVIYDVDYTGYIPKNQIRHFYAYEQTPERENVLPLSAVKKESGQGGADSSGSNGGGGASESGGSSGGQSGGSSGGQESTQKASSKPLSNTGTQNDFGGFEYLHKNYLAGEIALEGDIKTQTCGMAIFRDGKMIDECGGVEALLYNILTGDYVMSEISYKNSKTPEEPVTVIQSQRKKPKVSVDIDGERPKIKVNIYLEADLRTLNEGYVIEMDIDDFEEQVTAQIKDAAEKFLYKTAREYQSDIVGFGSYIKRHFKTFDEFEAYGWQSIYPDAEFEADVEFRVRRSGLINKKRD